MSDPIHAAQAVRERAGLYARSLRLQAQISRDELAEQAFLTSGADVALIEAGVRPVPATCVIRYAAALGVDPVVFGAEMDAAWKPRPFDALWSHAA